MKRWQKILLDPAAHTILRQLDRPKRKQELAEATGIENQRVTSILQELEVRQLVDHEMESGVRKFRLQNSYDRIKQLRLEVEDHTTLEVENAVKAGNFHEARRKLHRNPPVQELQKRKTIAKIEALQKLEQLPHETEEAQKQGRWQSLKGFIPRF